MMITGGILVAISIVGIIYSGSQVVRDETSVNVMGKNSLPKTAIGPVTAYNIEYTFVFILIFGFGIFGLGYLSREERKNLSQGTNL